MYSTLPYEHTFSALYSSISPTIYVLLAMKLHSQRASNRKPLHTLRVFVSRDYIVTTSRESGIVLYVEHVPLVGGCFR